MLVLVLDVQAGKRAGSLSLFADGRVFFFSVGDGTSSSSRERGGEVGFVLVVVVEPRKDWMRVMAADILLVQGGLSTWVQTTLERGKSQGTEG